MMNLVQGDCKCGALAFVAGENLSAATGLLVKLSPSGKAVKPAAAADITPYVVACGAFEGYLCGVVPLSSAANCRVALKGACLPGALLVAVGDGRVEAGSLSGAAAPVGVAEEAGVDGQRVLLRPLTVGARGGAGAAGAAGASGADGAPGAAGLPGGAFNLKASEISTLDPMTWPGGLGKVLFLNGGVWYGYAPSDGSSLRLAAVIVGVLDADAPDPTFVLRTVMEMAWPAGHFVTLPRSVIGGTVTLGEWVNLTGTYGAEGWGLAAASSGGGPMGANSLVPVSAAGPEILLVTGCYV